MLSRKIATGVAITCVTASLGTAGAQAVAASGDATHNQGRVVVERASEQLAEYSDRELLEFLVAGQGAVAEDHPELLRFLGFSADKPTTPQGPLNRFMRDYFAADPDFHATVAVPLQSGDPQAVDAALRQFTVEFKDVLQAKVAETSASARANDAQAAGWTWKGANVAVYANAVAVANAGVYANVAVATFVGAVLAVWYLEDGSMTGADIEVETFVAKVTDALAS